MKLDGTGSCSLALVNRMRHLFFRYIRFIGGVINNHRAHFVCIIHPLLKLGFGDCGACRIVGEAQINQIRRFSFPRRNLRRKIIFRNAGHINYVAPGFPCAVIGTCSSRHHVGVHINRINRVADCNFIVHAEYFLNVSRIAFCAVGYENLIRGNIASSCFIIVFADCIPKELIAKVRGIPFKGFRPGHFVHRPVKRRDNRRGKGLCHIADSKTDNLFIRMCRRIGVHLFSYS